MKSETRASRMWLFAAGLALFLPACTSTHFQSSRSPAGREASPFSTVMVVAVDERSEVRDPFENDVVRLLRERGVSGTASHDQFTFAEVKGDAERVRLRLKAADVASLLVVRVTDQADFVDGPPASPGSLDAGAVAESRYNAFTTPGGDINTAFRLGARVFRTADGVVIWSGALDEVLKDGEDPIVFIRKTAKAIVDRLARDKVIP